MSRNFYALKTGHKPSDDYFKNQPYWFDSDLLHAFIVGVIIGSLVLGIFSCIS